MSILSSYLYLWLIKSLYYSWTLYYDRLCMCVLCIHKGKASGLQWFHAPLRLHFAQTGTDIFVLPAIGLWNVSFMCMTWYSGSYQPRWLPTNIIKCLMTSKGSQSQAVWDSGAVSGRGRRKRTAVQPHYTLNTTQRDCWWLMAAFCSTPQHLTHHPGVRLPLRLC